MIDNTCNIDPQFRRGLITSTVIMHSFLPLVFWFFALTIVPIFMRIYQDFGITPPLPTQITLSMSRFVIYFWYLYFLILGVVLTLDGLFYSYLWRSGKKEPILLWPGGILFLQVIFGTIFIFGIALLPFAKVHWDVVGGK